MATRSLRCKGCGRRPWQIDEMLFKADVEGMTPDEYVKLEEPTYNPDTNLFYCTECFNRAGRPRGRA